MEIGTAVQAIEFALTIDDHYEMRGFLDRWMHGDIEEWPDYVIWLDKQH